MIHSVNNHCSPPVGRSAGRSAWTARDGLVSLLLLFAPALCAQSLQLSPQAWQKQLTLPPGVTPSQAAQFSETGKEIVIGPWIAGTFTARLEYAKPLPPTEGAIQGQYRTDNLYPHEAMVRVTFNKDNKRISALNYPLGVADQWEPFTIPIVRAPAGADSVLVSFGLAERTNGRVHFTNLRIAGPYQPPAFPAHHSPLTRSSPPQSLKPGQFVRLQKTEDQAGETGGWSTPTANPSSRWEA